MSEVVLHITSWVDWEASQEAGEYRAASLETEGFIHLSRPEQVVFAANRFYRGQTDLVLLVIDSVRLTAPLRWDNVPGHGIFPHLYGPLNRDAIIEILPFPPGSDGTFTLPEGIAVAG